MLALYIIFVVVVVVVSLKVDKGLNY